jgi:aspartate kinase
MALLVQKFGGTSVGSIERIEAVADKLASYKDQGHTLVVVVSAMSGETNRLTELAQQVDPQARGRELDVLLTTGEQVTIALLAMALEKRGYPARSYTGGQVKITTDSTHNKARIKSIDHERITNDLENGRIVVVAGFQGVDEHNNITTLGRGGSDTTGVALAAALKADECQIFTDVDGVYTTDPRVEPEARRLETITFEEMLEMASLGSKVLQIRAVEFAQKYDVPLRVLSSFEEGEGTLITTEYGADKIMEQALISGIAFNYQRRIRYPGCRLPDPGSDLGCQYRSRYDSAKRQCRRYHRFYLYRASKRLRNRVCLAATDRARIEGA